MAKTIRAMTTDWDHVSSKPSKKDRRVNRKSEKREVETETREYLDR